MINFSSMKLFFNLFVFLLLFSEAFSQANSDEYGGYFEPHPNKNIIIAPGLLGPNALPVQRIRNGLVGSNFEFQNQPVVAFYGRRQHLQY